MHIYDNILLDSSWNEKGLRLVKIHILCPITALPHLPENQTLYEIMRTNIVEPERPQMTT